MTALVTVEDLQVCAGSGTPGETPLVRHVSFSIARGEVLALIGESGSGKTTIALALMGYARAGCAITGGRITVGDVDVRDLTSGALARFRGRKVAYIAQSAAAAFNPAMTIMDQVVEPALVHGLISRRAAEAKAVALFHSLALPGAETIGRRYPHQVSGGQLQRLMAAMALITDPDLVILDEPTTALDVTTQIEALRVFKKVVRERGATAVYVSHDLAVVAQMADRILVLRHGEARECGPAEQVLTAPADAYTRTLMAAVHPREVAPAKASPAGAAPLLELRDVSAGYGPTNAAGEPRSLVLRQIDLTLARGATLGVIGESGSGKSTLARVIAGLIPASAGEVRLDGRRLAPALAERSREDLRRVQIVFQNADTALNPAHTVARTLARPLELYRGLRDEAQRRRVRELLDLIRLPATVADRRCSELSGGQKQRVNLARALAAEPDLVLCDEVTSALDTVVAAAMLELLAELRRDLGLSMIFISHDISTVHAICDEVAVLYAGRKVEAGPKRGFGAPPRHPYTGQLVDSVPQMQRGWLERIGQGAPANLPAASDPALCSYLGRCPVAIAGVCDAAPPPRRRLRSGSEVLCHHSEQELLAAQGAQRPRERAL